MKYRFVKGFRGSDLVHVLSHKCLFRFKRNKKNGARDFVCYQTILSKPTKRKPSRNEDRCYCSASIRIYSNGKCKTINGTHAAHNDHEALMRDMEKSDNIKKHCRLAKNQYAEDSHRLPGRHIFQREISKYVLRSSPVEVSTMSFFAVRLFEQNFKKSVRLK